MNEFTGENADLNEVMQKRQARENTDTFDINAEYTPNNPFNSHSEMTITSNLHQFQFKNIQLIGFN